jgi:hypothetical protein
VAKKMLIIDDLTGEGGAHTRTLRFDGVDYEIDLTDKSFADLRTLLKPYLRASRSVSARTPSPLTRRPGQRSEAPKGEAAIIRAWARANDVPVTDRGRVAPAVRDAWVAAGSPR